MTWRSFLIGFGIACLAGCEAPAPPPIQKSLGYDVTPIVLPGCPMVVPPVRNRDGHVSTRLRESVDPQDLCKALRALRDGIEQVEPGGWRRVVSVDVWRMPPPGARRIDTAAYELHVYADIKDRPRLLGVSMSTVTGETKFFAVHR